MGIAASFLLALIAIPFLIQDSKEIETENESYSVEKPKIEKQKELISPKEDTSISLESNESLVVETDDKSGNNEGIIVVETTEKPKTVIVGDEDNVYMAELSNSSTIRDVENNSEVALVAEIDKSKIDEVLEETKTTKADDLNKEVDSLLKAAQKELFIKKEILTDTQVVDASLLLQEAEQEVAPSLKTKVYRVIENGFKKVKTAVAQRNNK